MTSEINILFRSLQLIPLTLVFIPLIKSCYARINKINGLRPTRLTLTFLVGGLIFSNLYFIIFSAFSISRTLPSSAIFLTIEKVVNLVAYFLLYFLFKKASTHEK